MQRSKKQVLCMTGIAIVFMIMAFLVEIKVVLSSDCAILKYFPVLRGHRGFGVNILLGCACSCLVVGLSEYIDYRRLKHNFEYKIDISINFLKKKLEEASKKESLLEIKEFRDAELEKFKTPHILGEGYTPFKWNKKQSEYSKKLIIVDYEVYMLFYSRLDIYMRAKEDKINRYYELLENNDEVDMIQQELWCKVKEIKRSIDASERYHFKEIKKSIKELSNQIDGLLNN